MPSTQTVFCRNDLREKVSAHGPIICCNQLRENIGAILYIGAKVSAHEPIFNLWQRL